jgi:Glycosyl hydrolase-like 10
MYFPMPKNISIPVRSRARRRSRRCLLAVFTSSFSIVQAAYAPASQAQNPDYCHIPPAEVSAKNVLRLAAQRGDSQSKANYSQIVAKHQNYVQSCRQKSWLKNQAIWIRLYPCDTSPGALEEIFDRMVNKGYNQVYIATFYAGKVLLPRSQNSTVWSSVLTNKGTEKTDLLADAIQRGRERGLKVYAWLYSLRFSSDYGMTPEGQAALAVNGRGETTSFSGEEGFFTSTNGANGSVFFADPYSEKARRDYTKMVQEVVRRRPDGVLFDYIRFPRGQGAQSIASQVKDLWIYSPESRQTLLGLAHNSKGTDLIQRYLDKGSITINDLKEVDKLYPDEDFPMWEGRTALENEAKISYEDKYPWIEWDLWQLTVAHASQGVVNFLQVASKPVEQQQVKSGAVFFPEANQPVGRRGYDSRLQAWDRFPSKMEWHPMAYATCNRSDCIVNGVQRVLNFAPPNTQVIPALAGTWGKPFEGRPSLEEQMDGIRRTLPQINSLSHFAFSWQEPELDYYRSVCKLK